MPNSRGGRDLVKPYGPGARKLPNKEFQILMEDAEVLPPPFMNFTGRPGTFNAVGERSFCVIIPDPEIAEDMLEDGWNVKQLKSREEGVEGDYYISVDVKYRDRHGNDLRPPKLKLITSKGSALLGEDQAEFLDQVDIAKVDLIINGRTRIDEDGSRKIKAYLQTYFCTVNEDYLELKYADMPEAEAPLAIEDPGKGDFIDVESEEVEN